MLFVTLLHVSTIPELSSDSLSAFIAIFPRANLNNSGSSKKLQIFFLASV
jgi:hypothetical protein